MNLAWPHPRMPLEFDPTDNDDYAMQQLDKRDSTAMAGVAGITTSVGGTVKASAAADVLDNSNGWVGSYRYSTKCR